MAIIAVAFTACTDDNFLAEVTLPAEATGNKMVVDAYAHDFTFDIKTEGQWKVESNSRFLHVSPTEGTGNATVTVSVQNNQSDERKEGNLTIVFPGHEEENKTITIEQKYAGDYGENAAELHRLLDAAEKKAAGDEAVLKRIAFLKLGLTAGDYELAMCKAYYGGDSKKFRAIKTEMQQWIRKTMFESPFALYPASISRTSILNVK